MDISSIVNLFQQRTNRIFATVELDTNTLFVLYDKNGSDTGVYAREIDVTNIATPSVGAEQLVWSGTWADFTGNASNSIAVLPDPLMKLSSTQLAYFFIAGSYAYTNKYLKLTKSAGTWTGTLVNVTVTNSYTSSTFYSLRTACGLQVIDSDRFIFTFSYTTTTYIHECNVTTGVTTNRLAANYSTIRGPEYPFSKWMALGSGKYLWVFKAETYVSARVLTVSGTTYTMGAINASTFNNSSNAVALYQNLVGTPTYNINGNYELPMTVSGDTVTFGSLKTMTSIPAGASTASGVYEVDADNRLLAWAGSPSTLTGYNFSTNLVQSYKESNIYLDYIEYQKQSNLRKDLNTPICIVKYLDINSNWQIGYKYLLSTTPSNPSFNTPSAVSATYPVYTDYKSESSVAIDSTRTLIAWNTGTNNYWRAVVATHSGTSVSYGSTIALYAGDSEYVANSGNISKLSDSVYLWTYRQIYSHYYDKAYAVPITLSGSNTITAGTFASYTFNTTPGYGYQTSDSKPDWAIKNGTTTRYSFRFTQEMYTGSGYDWRYHNLLSYTGSTLANAFSSSYSTSDSTSDAMYPTLTVLDKPSGTSTCRILVTYKQSSAIKAQIFTYTWATDGVTETAPVTLVSSDPGTAKQHCITWLSTDRLLLTYPNTTNMSAKVITISGTSITANTVFTSNFATGTISYHDTKAITDTTAIVSYVGGSTLYTYTITITGNVISGPTTRQTIDSTVSGSINPEACVPSGREYIAVLYKNSDNYPGYAFATLSSPSNFEYTSTGSMTSSATSTYNRDYEYISSGSSASSSSVSYFASQSFDYTSDGSLTSGSSATYGQDLPGPSYETSGSMSTGSTSGYSIDYEYISSGNMGSTSTTSSDKFSNPDYVSTGSMSTGSTSVTEIGINNFDYISSGSLSASSVTVTNKNIRYFGFTPTDSFVNTYSAAWEVYGSALTDTNTQTVLYSDYPNLCVQDTNILNVSKPSYLANSTFTINTDQGAKSPSSLVTANFNSSQYLFLVAKSGSAQKLHKLGRLGSSWTIVSSSSEQSIAFDTEQEKNIFYFSNGGEHFVVVAGLVSAKVFNVTTTPTLAYTWVYPTAALDNHMTVDTVRLTQISGQSFLVTYKGYSSYVAKAEVYYFDDSGAQSSSNALTLTNGLTNDQYQGTTPFGHVSAYSTTAIYVSYTYRDLTTTKYYFRILRLSVSANTLTASKNILIGYSTASTASNTHKIDAYSSTNVAVQVETSSPYMYNTTSESVVSTAAWSYSDVYTYNVIQKADGNQVWTAIHQIGSEYKIFVGGYGYYIDDDTYYYPTGSISIHSTSSYEVSIRNWDYISSGSLSASDSHVYTPGYEYPSATGSMSASGLGLTTRDYAVVSDGSLATGSSSEYNRDYAIIASGSLTSGSIATYNRDYEYISSGSQITSSTSSYDYSRDYSFTVNGSMASGSSSGYNRDYEYVNEGNLSASSSSTATWTTEWADYVTSGSLSLGSTISSNFGPMFTYETYGSMGVYDSSAIAWDSYWTITSSGALGSASVSSTDWSTIWDLVTSGSMISTSQSVTEFLASWSWSTSGAIHTGSTSSYNAQDFQKWHYETTGSIQTISDSIYDFLRSWSYVTSAPVNLDSAAISLYSRFFDYESSGDMLLDSTSEYYKREIRPLWEYTSEGNLTLRSVTTSYLESMQVVFCIVPITSTVSKATPVSNRVETDAKITGSRTINLNFMKRQDQGDQ